MKIAYIGSVALQGWLPLDRRPGDVDMVATYEDLQAEHKLLQPVKCYPFKGGEKYFAQLSSGEIYETEIAWPDSLAEELLGIIERDEATVHSPNEPEFMWASLDVLYMLKMSHRFLKNSPHFLKTMRDIQLMRKAGAKIRPEHEDFYKRRVAATYIYSHPKLNVSKKEFFSDDNIQYKYDHDTIHMAVKHMVKPAYNFFKPNEAEVFTSKELFWKQDAYVRLCSVLEEAYVLAIERSLVPHPNVLTRKEAFDMALMKLCTSISSGWWREYAWEHYDNVQALYNDNYFDKFLIGLNNGSIKNFKQD